MADSSPAAVSSAGKAESQKAKKAATAIKKPKTKVTHPPTSEMVTNAIKMLKERGGSSLPAIKKYLAGNYKVDIDKLAPFIRKYLKSAVASGDLIQTKGKGASGSFKLSKLVGTSKAKSTEAKTKKPAVTKKTAKKEKATGGTKKKAAAKKVDKKKAVKAVAKAAKKSGEVKSKAPKQKPTKSTKSAKSPKVAKPKASAAKKTPKKASKK